MFFKTLFVFLIILILLIRTSDFTNNNLNYARFKSAPITVNPEITKLDNLESTKAFDQVQQLVSTKNGTYGIYIYNYSTQEEFEVNSEKSFYAASLYKVPIAVALLKSVQNSEISLDDRVGGYSYQTLLNLLLKDSDNGAQDILWNRLGATKIGTSFDFLTNTSNGDFLKLNQSNPREISKVFLNIKDSDYLNEQNKDLFFSTMEQTSFDNRIHLGLTQDLKFSHKIGTWPDQRNWHDCGFVLSKNLFVCVMSENTNEADFLEIAKKVGEFVTTL